MRVFVSSVTIALVVLPMSFLVAADDAADGKNAKNPQPAEQIRGEWVLYRDTPRGRFMTIKEHLGNQTVVTTYDPNNKAVQSHRSEYRVDVDGGVPIFRYRNRVILIGPDAGAKDERESAYLFRIEGDRFYEVHGMLPGDQGQPSLIVWERLKVNPIPKPAAT